jgi:hypothetical protein
MSSLYHKQCLVLNADYTPLSIIDWQKAFIWHMRHENNPKYGIEIVNFYQNDHINGTTKKYPVPAVAKTKRFFKPKNTAIIFSRKNLFLRDNYTCQYCNKQFDNKYLTYDHVIPKSKWNNDNGSPTTWTNIVTACVRCNLKKGNRTPTQANMPLVNLPIKPNKCCRYLPISHHLRKIIGQIPEEWQVYLPESYF